MTRSSSSVLSGAGGISGTEALPSFQFLPDIGIQKHSILFTILSLLIAYLWRTYYYHGLNKIPGPLMAKFTSLWKWNIVRQEQMPFVNTKLHEIYGPLVRIGPNHVSASSSEAIQVVHRSKSGFTKVASLLFLIHNYTCWHKFTV